MAAYESPLLPQNIKEAVRPYQYALVLAAIGCVTFGTVMLVMMLATMQHLEACAASSVSPAHYVFDPLYIQGQKPKM